MVDRLINSIVSIVMIAGIALSSGCGRQPELDKVHEVVEDNSEQSVDQDTQTGAEIENHEPVSKSDDKSSDLEEMEEDAVETNQIYIRVGENTLTAVLEDNESAEALKELMVDGPLTISASNYGGFEKVCSLGTTLPRNDSQTTTHAGDICLYSGNQIVIFYGSNSWAYTRLGKISDADAGELEKVLSGEETEITLSLESF